MTSRPEHPEGCRRGNHGWIIESGCHREHWSELRSSLPAERDEPERCPQVAGRCEKAAGHDGDHFTTYEEGVWVWRKREAATLAEWARAEFTRAGAAETYQPEDAAYHKGWAAAMDALLARLSPPTDTGAER